MAMTGAQPELPGLATTAPRPGRATGPVIHEARDIPLLRWITRHGLVTPQQVARAMQRDGGGELPRPFFTSQPAAYRRLAKLRTLGLIQEERTFWKEPNVIRVRKPGAELADVGLQPARIVWAELRHTLALVDLNERLLTENAGATLRTERELRAQRLSEKRATGKKLSGHPPDAVLVMAAGEEVAVELDLTRKRSARYAGIIRAYRKEPYKRVLWYIVAEKTPRKAGEESSRVRDLRTIMVKNEAASLIEVREWIPTVGHDHDH
jgi:hypothetical protein